MPADACDAFSNLMGAKSQECASAVANLGNKAAIVGGTIGGIAGLACLCCICYVAARRVADCRYSRIDNFFWHHPEKVYLYSG